MWKTHSPKHINGEDMSQRFTKRGLAPGNDTGKRA